jgi:spore germination protein YaaH
VAFVVVIVLSAAALVAAPYLLLRGDPPRPMVVASLPVWNLEKGTRTIAAQAESFGTASPSLYEVSPEGEVVARPQPEGVSADEHLATLREHGVALVPLISNTRVGNWDPALIQRILHDPALVDRHVAAIVELARREDFAGIGIDYQELVEADRNAFSAFVRRLADALHAQDRILHVEVFAKESDAGYDDRNRAQDYAAIGKAADQVRIMAYDRHWQSGPAGPVAPADWVEDVLAYAVQEIPAHKVVLDIPTHGYAWDGDGGRLISWLQAYAQAQALDVPIRWDGAAQSPWLRYRDAEGVQHTFWFENSHSIRVKLELAQSQGIGGVCLRLVGDEDDGMWPVVADFAGGAALSTEGAG